MKIVMLESLGICEKSLNNFAERLRKFGHEFIFYNTRIEDEKVIIERAKDAEVIIVTNLPLSAQVIKSCLKLKMISIAFTGVDHIDMETCRENNITVCNSSGYANQSVAELVFGLIISLKRHIVSCNAVVREGKTRQGFIGNELLGSKMGIIGTGAIGMKVAELAKAFGCGLLGYDISKNKEVLQTGLKYVDLNMLMKESDIITVHVPLLESTRNLINKDKISLMKPSAILINAARGPVVDSEALANALNQGKIAGAGIDVFEMEPPIPKNHPLLHAKHSVLTPHVAFATHESFNKRAKIVFNNIFKWFEGCPQNVIN